MKNCKGMFLKTVVLFVFLMVLNTICLVASEGLTETEVIAPDYYVELPEPVGMCIGESGTLYVLVHLDGKGDFVQVISHNGVLEKSLALPGNNTAGDSCLYEDITIDSEGLLYIVNKSEYTYLTYDMTGEVFQTVDFSEAKNDVAIESSTGPTTIHVSENGDVIIHDIHVESGKSHETAIICDSEGTYQKVIETHLNGLTMDSDGYLNGISYDGSIKRIDYETGTIKGVVYTNLSNGYSLGLDANNHYYAITVNEEQYKLNHIGSDGTELNSLVYMGAGYMESPNPIDVECYLGEIYILDSANETIDIYDSSLSFIKHIGKSGINPGGISDPVSLCMDSEGRLFVLNSLSKDISQYDMEGNTTLYTSNLHLSAYSEAKDMDIGSDGAIYAIIRGNQTVSKIVNGSIVANYPTDLELSDPSAVMVDENGTIYVFDQFDKKLYWLDVKGSELGSYQFSDNNAVIMDMEIGSNGRLYLTDIKDRLWILEQVDEDEDGIVDELQVSRSVSVIAPNGLTVDSEGMVYVTSALTHQISKFTEDGNAAATPYSSPWISPVDIVVADSLEMYIIDSQWDNLQRISAPALTDLTINGETIGFDRLTYTYNLSGYEVGDAVLDLVMDSQCSGLYINGHQYGDGEEKTVTLENGSNEIVISVSSGGFFPEQVYTLVVEAMDATTDIFENLMPVEWSAIESSLLNEKEIILEGKEDNKGYHITIPSSLLMTDNGITYSLQTDIGTIELPDCLFCGSELQSDEIVDMVISSDVADQSGLSIMFYKDLEPVILDETISKMTIKLYYAGTFSDNEKVCAKFGDGSVSGKSISNTYFNEESQAVVFETADTGSFWVVCLNITFTDTKHISWANGPIEVMASKGITNGTGNNTFTPDRLVSRGEFLTLLMRAFELYGIPDTQFEDVKLGTYYYDSVATAKALNITQGAVTGMNFYPLETITREDMMYFAVGALEAAGVELVPNGEKTILDFQDRDQISSYAYLACDKLVSAGLIQGSNGLLNPQGETTRAQSAVFIYRLYQLLIESK